MKKFLLKASVIAAIAFFLNSCGNSDNTLGTGTGAPPDESGFVGSTVSFNPTITFFANGLIEYVNEETGSGFPRAAANRPQPGTFTYKSFDGGARARMTINLPNVGSGWSRQLSLTDFIVEDELVKGFTVTFSNEGSFAATVDGGTIKAGGKRSSGFPDLGGGTGGDGNGNGNGAGNDFTYTENGNIAAGTTFTKANTSTFYSGFGGSGLTWSPLPVSPVGEEVTFTISGSGAFTMGGVDRKFGTGPYTLSVPFVSREGGVITYRGFDGQSGGVLLVTFDVEDSNLLTVKWSDTFYADFEQQSFQ